MTYDETPPKAVAPVSATPALDKARTEELTSGEIKAALRELEMLNGAGTRALLHVESGYTRIGWSNGMHYGGMAYREIEDALVAERDMILKAMAETEPAS